MPLSPACLHTHTHTHTPKLLNSKHSDDEQLVLSVCETESSGVCVWTELSSVQYIYVCMLLEEYIYIYIYNYSLYNSV